MVIKAKNSEVPQIHTSLKQSLKEFCVVWRLSCVAARSWLTGKKWWLEQQSWQMGEVTLWLFNIAMENGPFINDFPIKYLHL